jgi:hypothetical protein
MTQSTFDPNAMSPPQPERCIDCEGRLLGADLQRMWSYCEYCGEAVCSSCDVSHSCQELRTNAPKK